MLSKLLSSVLSKSSSEFPKIAENNNNFHDHEHLKNISMSGKIWQRQTSNVFERNWVEESHLYMKDWLVELPSVGKAWLADSNPSTVELNEFVKEEQLYNEDWETESETELNMNIRDWIGESDDLLLVSSAYSRIEKPPLCGCEESDDDDQSEKICPISLEEFTDFKMTANPDSCSHKFSYSSLKRWSEYHHTCPMDRSVFTSINVFYCDLLVAIESVPPLDE